MENAPEVPNTLEFVVETILIWYVAAGERVLGNFQVKMPADVSTDFAIVFTTVPDWRS